MTDLHIHISAETVSPTRTRAMPFGTALPDEHCETLQKITALFLAPPDVLAEVLVVLCGEGIANGQDPFRPGAPRLTCGLVEDDSLG